MILHISIILAEHNGEENCIFYLLLSFQSLPWPNSMNLSRVSNPTQTLFQFSAGLNLKKFNTILVEWNLKWLNTKMGQTHSWMTTFYVPSSEYTGCPTKHDSWWIV